MSDPSLTFAKRHVGKIKFEHALLFCIKAVFFPLCSCTNDWSFSKYSCFQVVAIYKTDRGRSIDRELHRLLH